MSKKAFLHRALHTLVFAVAVIAVIVLAVILLDDDPSGSEFNRQLDSVVDGRP